MIISGPWPANRERAQVVGRGRERLAAFTALSVTRDAAELAPQCSAALCIRGAALWGQSWIAGAAPVVGAKALMIAISSSICGSVSTPAKPGIDVPIAPLRSVDRRSSSVGGVPIGVERQWNSPVVSARGRPQVNGAAGPRPSPEVPWQATQ